jgi:hypothetical protein
MSRSGFLAGLTLACLLLAAPPRLKAANAVQAGRFIVEPPTLICLGFSWQIAGDDNRNATVQVRYRKAGETAWKEALPLLRMGGEKVGRAAEQLDYTVPDEFAGSILDLEPDTAYEARLTMADPDGVTGPAVQTVKVRTRGEPKAAEGGRVLHVYPPTWRGTKQEPAFTGLMAAYYGSGGTGDWNVVWEKPASPGDVILVHAGLYKGDRLNYVDSLGLTFHGTYILTLKGTPERPIVIKSAGDGEAIFDGNGAYRLFDVMGSEYNIFDGLTIRNTDIAFDAGTKRVMGAKGLTVRNSRIENVGIAVNCEYAGSRDFYIADNVMIGRDDHYRINGWASPGIYGASQMNSYYAVKVYGQGHVICYNTVAFFHDGIDVSTYGTPETDEDLKPVAIDIYNNDIHLVVDDFIEGDGGVHNIRILRNRGVNSGQTGLSAQPIFGGPAYYIRNVLYQIPNGVAFKFMAKPAGLYVYHNTVIAESRNRETFSNAHFRNNLILGTESQGRGTMIFPSATAYSTYDYDGFRPNRNGGDPYTWIAPEKGLLRNYEARAGSITQTFKTLAELAAATGQESHGIEVDYDVFENLRPPDPAKPRAVYFGRDLDFRLKPGGKAVDAGVRLPNVNDDFTGKAPDLGAYEVGKPAPVYGPRTQPGSPF